MAKIFKYVIDPDGTVVGVGSVVRLLTTAWQGDDLCVWGEVEDWSYGEILSVPPGLHVVPVPTGLEPPVGYHYLGTAHPNGGSPDFAGRGIVMHVYYIPLRRYE